MHPLPLELRLITPTPGTKRPPPPFGLRFWNSDAQATALLLDARHQKRMDVAAVVAQVPRASTLGPRTPMVIFGAADCGGGALRRLFGGASVNVPRAARCTALVARGYVDVGGGADAVTGADLAWGWSP
jgi:hypothetical protein